MLFVKNRGFDMNVVITMGGLGKRFREVGYDIPKYEIIVNGKTLFEWSLLSLKDFWGENFIFVVKKDDNATGFIAQKCYSFGIKYFIVELDKLTSGQAESALFAEAFWNRDKGLFIYNIDTYIEEGGLLLANIKGDGYIPCFKGDGCHWSFVKIDENGKAVDVAEKRRISDNCSVGAYYFKTADLYKKIYYEFYNNDQNIECGERYIAPMYKWMIQNGYNVYIEDIDKTRVHVLGTPKEVEEFARGYVGDK